MANLQRLVYFCNEQARADDDLVRCRGPGCKQCCGHNKLDARPERQWDASCDLCNGTIAVLGGAGEVVIPPVAGDGGGPAPSGFSTPFILQPVGEGAGGNAGHVPENQPQQVVHALRRQVQHELARNAEMVRKLAYKEELLSDQLARNAEMARSLNAKDELIHKMRRKIEDATESADAEGADVSADDAETGPKKAPQPTGAGLDPQKGLKADVPGLTHLLRDLLAELKEHTKTEYSEPEPASRTLSPLPFSYQQSESY